ncbi:hypothetical protein [Gordonia aurantiaca]|uniref:hypothetical protein n=1 Tax=Gordonia sp. B21 TaxID=3151852 RepID=UPI003266CF94
MNRIAATATLTLAILMGGAGIATAEKPCMMPIGDGQWAPCPPPVISTGPGDDGPDNSSPPPSAPRIYYIYETPYGYPFWGDPYEDGWFPY